MHPSRTRGAISGAPTAGFYRILSVGVRYLGRKEAHQRRGWSPWRCSLFLPASPCDRTGRLPRSTASVPAFVLGPLIAVTHLIVIWGAVMSIDNGRSRRAYGRGAAAGRPVESIGSLAVHRLGRAAPGRLGRQVPGVAEQDRDARAAEVIYPSAGHAAVQPSRRRLQGGCVSTPTGCGSPSSRATVRTSHRTGPNRVA